MKTKTLADFQIYISVILSNSSVKTFKSNLVSLTLPNQTGGFPISAFLVKSLINKN